MSDLGFFVSLVICALLGLALGVAWRSDIARIDEREQAQQIQLCLARVDQVELSLERCLETCSPPRSCTPPRPL